MANIPFPQMVVHGIHKPASFLKLDHHIHFSIEKSIIERTMQHIKNRAETFDDYFPCRNNKCKLNHVKQWFNLFVDQHNKKIIS